MKNENLGQVFLKAESEGNTIILIFGSVDTASEVAKMLCDHSPFPMKVAVMFKEDDGNEHD